MRVKIREVGKALHPSEMIVEVITSTGKEQLVVDKRSVEGGSISVGSPIAKNNDFWLVELPRETVSGSWRVWVKNNALINDPVKVRAA